MRTRLAINIHRIFARTIVIRVGVGLEFQRQNKSSGVYYSVFVSDWDGRVHRKGGLLFRKINFVGSWIFSACSTFIILKRKLNISLILYPRIRMLKDSPLRRW